MMVKSILLTLLLVLSGYSVVADDATKSVETDVTAIPIPCPQQGVPCVYVPPGNCHVTEFLPGYFSVQLSSERCMISIYYGAKAIPTPQPGYPYVGAKIPSSAAPSNNKVCSVHPGPPPSFDPVHITQSGITWEYNERAQSPRVEQTEPTNPVICFFWAWQSVQEIQK